MNNDPKNLPICILDQDVLNNLKPWQQEIEILPKILIGSVETTLEHRIAHESTLGNFITDSMIHHVSILKSNQNNSIQFNLFSFVLCVCYNQF